ncbi:MAG: signal peptidase I [Bacilli bacterium]|nr:signal peptidase I [Bacilli bacterium]
MDCEVRRAKALPPKAGKTKRNKNNLGKNMFEGIFSVALAFVFGVSGQFIYNFTRYAPFMVDGESMYPTLNYDTRIEYDDGTFYDDPENTWKIKDFSGDATYICDYGLMDSNKGFTKNLKRFDIVITYYPGDYVGDELKTNASLKVKRIVGLPGETIKFDNSGTLYILKGEEDDFSPVEQPFLSYENNKATKPLVSESWYQAAMNETSQGYMAPFTLGEGEYYVVGDNRRLGASLDSRSSIVGAIKENMLVGKAVAIVTKCRYVPGQEPKVMYTKYILPWRIEDL